MFRLLRVALDRVVDQGNLTAVDAAGISHRFGDGSGKEIAVRFATRAAERGIALDPELKLGEAFADGSLVVEKGSIYDFLAVILENAEKHPPPKWAMALNGPRYLFRRFAQRNMVRRAQQNIAHHYDLDGGLYDLFLDPDKQYSCAYFEDETRSLDEAQLAKKRHLTAKLDLRDGHKVLDIGSGWGGLGLYMAKQARCSVSGITLSKEQHRISNDRAAREGLAKAVEFHLQDYRTLEGPFDRIISVGMFEHVGVGYYREFFSRVRDMLTDDGVFVLHSIGRFYGPSFTNPWIAKYIFPGGYIPALSEVIPVIEKTGLLVTDVEILRLHYAETLRAWRQRFLANRDKARELYDERFCRIWEFYLAASETAFRYQGLMNFQLQIAKNQHVLPLTRDYIYEREEAMRHGDSRKAGSRRIAGE